MVVPIFKPPQVSYSCLYSPLPFWNLLTEGKRGKLTLDPDFETTSSHTSNANLWSGKCCSCMMYMYRNNIFCEKWMAKKSSLGAADHNDNKELMLS